MNPRPSVHFLAQTTGRSGRHMRARRGEAFNTQWTDVDLANRTIRITPEKGSNPRIFRISEGLT